MAPGNDPAPPTLRHVRVLLCLSAYKPALDYGGPVTKVALLAPALQELGVDVEIATANFGERRAPVPPGRRMVDGVPVTYLRRVVTRNWLSVAPGSRRVLRSDFDVVHCFGLRDGMVSAAAFGARRVGIPLVLEPMGMAVPRIRNAGIKQAFDRLAQSAVHGATATIATSELEAGELRSLGYQNVVVRPNPIALVLTMAPRPDAIYDICYIGRLHTKKRLNDIVSALAAHPAWTAVIAGPDEDGTAAVLASAASKAGVERRLTLKGWVHEDERDALIRSSRVFVLPSATENFGNAAAEAIALGTPVVVTDQCGVAELVRQTNFGAVVPVKTDAVVAAIEGVLNGRAAGEFDALARYAPAAVAAQQKAIYELVTKATTRSS